MTDIDSTWIPPLKINWSIPNSQTNMAFRLITARAFKIKEDSRTGSDMVSEEVNLMMNDFKVCAINMFHIRFFLCSLLTCDFHVNNIFSFNLLYSFLLCYIYLPTGHWLVIFVFAIQIHLGLTQVVDKLGADELEKQSSTTQSDNVERYNAAGNMIEQQRMYITGVLL